ncbi:MAG TPA: DCC1-like thiol-disulfide oxidoreductase family protein [Cyclobacteriaceae bacterium]|nr:DCC1-like thiol-disulfide oxidoreductase family protein [Cyclobacteriaceae bacterium]
MTTPSIVLFDGVCNLCNGFVNFIIDRDPNLLFRFGSLQSQKAKILLQDHPTELHELNTVVLLEGSKLYTRSTAALRIVRKLNGAWPILYVFIIIPRPFRDVVYNFIARKRYRWFGRQEVCRIPTPALQSRFIE